MKIYEIEFNDSECERVYYMEAPSLLEALRIAREKFTSGLYDSIEGIRLRCNILESINQE